MHRLTVLAFALLLTFASVFPSVLARETNAYRLKRGYPPLPPTRREVGKRSQPSPSAVAHVANTVSGVLEVRDSSGAHHIGFVENVSNRLPDLGVTTGSKSSGLQATFSWQDKTVVATNAVFNPPFFLGSDFPNASPPDETLLTTVKDIPGAHIWCFDSSTWELTVSFPDPNGGTVPAQFVWDQSNNALSLVTDWQPEVVRIFLTN